MVGWNKRKTKISFTHTFQGQVTNYGAVQFFFKENIFVNFFQGEIFFFKFLQREYFGNKSYCSCALWQCNGQLRKQQWCSFYATHNDCYCCCIPLNILLLLLLLLSSRDNGSATNRSRRSVFSHCATSQRPGGLIWFFICFLLSFLH